MQDELDRNDPDLGIQILGVNEWDQPTGIDSATVGRTIPFLQDVKFTDPGPPAKDVGYVAQELWGVISRDVVILDRANVKVGVFNLTTHDLGYESGKRPEVTARSLEAGTTETGTFSNTITDDDREWVIKEVAGQNPGFGVQFTVGNIRNSADALVIKGWYDGDPGDAVQVAVFNGLDWDDLGTLPDASSQETYSFALDENHTSSGSVRVRIQQTTSGTAGHALHLDQIKVDGLVNSENYETLKQMLIDAANVEAVAPWHNSEEPLDVDGDGDISPVQDVMAVVNELNNRAISSATDGLLPNPPVDPQVPPPYLDVNADGYVSTVQDLMPIVNYLNDSPGEPEGEMATPVGQTAADGSPANELPESYALSLPPVSSPSAGWESTPASHAALGRMQPQASVDPNFPDSTAALTSPAAAAERLVGQGPLSGVADSLLDDLAADLAPLWFGLDNLTTT